MKSFLIALFSLLFLPLAQAGSADAVIKGTSASGRTSFEMHVQDLDGAVTWAKLTIDGKSYTVAHGEKGIHRESIVFDRKNKVYVVTFHTPKRVVRFWAIPRTFKVQQDSGHAFKARFSAILEATDPRQDSKWKMTPKITLPCTVDYSI